MSSHQPEPADIEAEIERTRAELADTIDAIAEKMSPKRAVSRTAEKVKAAVMGDTRPGATVGITETGERLSVVATTEASHQVHTEHGGPGPIGGRTAADRASDAARATGMPGGTEGGGTLYTVQRSLRADRVLMAAGAVLAVVALVALARRGGDDEFAWTYESFDEWEE